MFRFVAKNIRYWVLNRPSPEKFVQWFNTTNGVVWRLPVRLRYEPVSGCMIADDGKSQVYFCRSRESIDTGTG